MWHSATFWVSSRVIYMPNKCGQQQLKLRESRNGRGPVNEYREFLKKNILSWSKQTCSSGHDLKDSYRSRQATWKGECFSRNLIKASWSTRNPGRRNKIEKMKIRGVRGSVEIFTEGKQRRKLEMETCSDYFKLWSLRVSSILCCLIKCTVLNLSIVFV